MGHGEDAMLLRSRHAAVVLCMVISLVCMISDIAAETVNPGTDPFVGAGPASAALSAAGSAEWAPPQPTSSDMMPQAEARASAAAQPAVSSYPNFTVDVNGDGTIDRWGWQIPNGNVYWQGDLGQGSNGTPGSVANAGGWDTDGDGKVDVIDFLPDPLPSGFEHLAAVTNNKKRKPPLNRPPGIQVPWFDESLKVEPPTVEPVASDDGSGVDNGNGGGGTVSAGPSIDDIGKAVNGKTIQQAKNILKKLGLDPTPLFFPPGSRVLIGWIVALPNGTSAQVIDTADNDKLVDSVTEVMYGS